MGRSAPRRAWFKKNEAERLLAASFLFLPALLGAASPKAPGGADAMLLTLLLILVLPLAAVWRGGGAASQVDASGLKVTATGTHDSR